MIIKKFARAYYRDELIKADGVDRRLSTSQVGTLLKVGQRNEPHPKYYEEENKV